VQLFHAENTASMISLIPEDAPIYRYPMCNGTEYSFYQCQLPRSDSNSVCSSIGTVNCTEGIQKCISIINEFYALWSKFMAYVVITRCYGEGRFRLVNQTTDSSFDSSGSSTVTATGRIEVCSNSSYKSLCDQYWDPIDAQVFCQDYLRYRSPFSSKISKKSIKFIAII
jgi:hypothetical protein